RAGLARRRARRVRGVAAALPRARPARALPRGRGGARGRALLAGRTLDPEGPAVCAPARPRGLHGARPPSAGARDRPPPRVRGGRLGARARRRPDLAELRAVRGAAGAGSRALGARARRAAGAPLAQGPLPARQPPALQPEVRAQLAAALRRVRAATGPAAD